MAKRFTETAKWDDAWFVSLTVTQKLAWIYLCDKCDLAGVVDLAVGLAEFHLGGEFDWDGFIAASEGRIERLADGKLHLTRFVAWQFGKLNENNNAHRAVVKTLEKHGLSVSTKPGAGQPLGTHSPGAQDKDKDKDKDKELEGGVGGTKPAPPSKSRTSAAATIPCNFSLPLREKVSEWLRYKGERRESYKPTGLKAFFGEVANIAKSEGESVVIARMERAMANGWRGWNHADHGTRGSPEPADRREAEIQKAAAILERNRERQQPQHSDQHLLRDHRGADP